MGTHESEIIDEIIVSMQRTPLKKLRDTGSNRYFLDRTVASCINLEIKSNV